LDKIRGLGWGSENRR